MPNTVFFSFLGVGDYVDVRYNLGNVATAKREKFVQPAILECLRGDDQALQPDRAIIALTEAARARHWQGLERRFAEMHVEATTIDILDGRDEQELWTIFSSIGEALTGSERVVVDLTHGFRSLPVTAILALSFFRHVLDLKQVQVYYGAAEVLGDAKTLRELADNHPAFHAKVYGSAETPAPQPLQKLRDWTPCPLDEDCMIAPIFDLTPMFEVPAWAEALTEWKRTGRSEGLVERFKPYTDALGRKLGKNAPQALRALPKSMQLLGDSLTLVRNDLISANATNVLATIDSAAVEIQGHPQLEPLRFVINALRDRVAPLSQPDANAASITDGYLRHQLRTARWLGDRRRIVEAFSILRELLTSCAVRIGVAAGIAHLYGSGATNKDYRGTVDGELAVVTGALPKPREDTPTMALLRVWLSQHNAVEIAFRTAYGKVQPHRNKLDHCWTGAENARETFNHQSLAGLQATLGVAFAETEKLIDAVVNLTSALAPLPSNSLFLNVSNHPIHGWHSSQREAAVALGFGPPADLPGGLLDVDPLLDTSGIALLADEIASRVDAAGARGAFVATEPTLTLALVHALHHRGIRTFAATTRRVAECIVEPDGSTRKISTFSFVQWREYPYAAS